MGDKSELKLFGEIAARVAKLSDSGKGLAKVELTSGASPQSIRIVEQIAGRYAALTPEGRNYVNKTLGLDTPAE